MRALTVIMSECDSAQRTQIKQILKSYSINLTAYSITSKKNIIQKATVEDVDVIVISDSGSSNKRFTLSDVICFTQDVPDVRVVYLLQSRNLYDENFIYELFKNKIYNVLFRDDCTSEAIAALLVCGRTQEEAAGYMKISAENPVFAPISDEVISKLNHYIMSATTQAEMIQRFHSKIAIYDEKRQKYYCENIKNPILIQTLKDDELFSKYVVIEEPPSKTSIFTKMFKKGTAKKAEKPKTVKDTESNTQTSFTTTPANEGVLHSRPSLLWEVEHTEPEVETEETLKDIKEEKTEEVKLEEIRAEEVKDGLDMPENNIHEKDKAGATTLTTEQEEITVVEQKEDAETEKGLDFPQAEIFPPVQQSSVISFVDVVPAKEPKSSYKDYIKRKEQKEKAKPEKTLPVQEGADITNTSDVIPPEPVVKPSDSKIEHVITDRNEHQKQYEDELNKKEQELAKKQRDIEERYQAIKSRKEQNELEEERLKEQRESLELQRKQIDDTAETVAKQQKQHEEELKKKEYELAQQQKDIEKHYQAIRSSKEQNEREEMALQEQRRTLEVQRKEIDNAATTVTELQKQHEEELQKKESELIQQQKDIEKHYQTIQSRKEQNEREEKKLKEQRELLEIQRKQIDNTAAAVAEQQKRHERELREKEQELARQQKDIEEHYRVVRSSKEQNKLEEEKLKKQKASLENQRKQMTKELQEKERKLQKERVQSHVQKYDWKLVRMLCIATVSVVIVIAVAVTSLIVITKKERWVQAEFPSPVAMRNIKSISVASDTEELEPVTEKPASETASTEMTSSTEKTTAKATTEATVNVTQAPLPATTTEATTEATTSSQPTADVSGYDGTVCTGSEVISIINNYGGGVGITVEMRTGTLSFGLYGSDDVSQIDTSASFYCTVTYINGVAAAVRFTQG